MDDELRLEMHGLDARRQYARELLDAYIALQIKTLRLQRGWSQTELAEQSRLRQSQISSMEQIDFQSWTLATLRKLAEGFDLALIVRFESFGKFLDEATTLDRASLYRKSFVDDPAFSDSASPSDPSTRDSVVDISTYHKYKWVPMLTTSEAVKVATEAKAAAHG